MSPAYFIFEVSNSQLNSDYLELIFNTSEFDRAATFYAVGGVRGTLTLDDFCKMEINVPDIAEQERVVKIYNVINNRIKILNALNKNLEEQAQTIFKHWFIDFEFPNEEGKPYKSSGGKLIWNEELQKEIPEGWEVKSLGEIAEINAGGDKPINISYKRTDIFKYPIFSNGVTDNGLYAYTDKAKILNESVTISSRGTIGFICLRYEPFFPIVRLISLIPKYNISTKYLYFSLKCFNIKALITGTTQQQLTVPDLKKVNIIIPTMQIMNTFSYIQNPMFEVIRNYSFESQRLAELRELLLPKLLS